jgi:hypothetical protein
MSVQLGVGVVEAPRLTACGPKDDVTCRCAACVWMNLNSQEHVSPHTWSTTSSAPMTSDAVVSRSTSRRDLTAAPSDEGQSGNGEMGQGDPRLDRCGVRART